MRARFESQRSALCKWLLRLALVSFVGLYSIGLLPHTHAAAAPDDLNCPVCHVVSGLQNLTGNSSPPAFQLTHYVLQLLLVLPWLIVAIPRAGKALLLKQSRAPPAYS